MTGNFSAEEHFRRGNAEFDAGRLAKSLEHFATAHRIDPLSPRYRSYYGLCLGLVDRRFDKALELCRSAAKEEFFNPALYHNLARVHLGFGFKTEAIRYLRRGLMIDPECSAIADELEQLGLREKPVLGFLRRQNPLNRWFGQIRSRLRNEQLAKLAS